MVSVEAMATIIVGGQKIRELSLKKGLFAAICLIHMLALPIIILPCLCFGSIIMFLVALGLLVL